MKILLLDNHDSFTYNLYHLLRQAGAGTVDVRSHELSVTDADKYSCIVFSPGPGLPGQAGNMEAIIRAYAHHRKMLGVCLGHQAIGEVFGAKVVASGQIMHGMATPLVILDHNCLFQNIETLTPVGRYHSWMLQIQDLSGVLQVTATDQAGNIMAIRHRDLPIFGVQFHPESVMTPSGVDMLRNWLRI